MPCHCVERHATCYVEGAAAKAGKNQSTEKTQMNTMLINLYVKFQDLMNREEGQDLVEYALVVALIAFGATAGMSALAGGLNTAFSNIYTVLGNYTV
jgi:pilus assembly protein Flp/PilA